MSGAWRWAQGGGWGGALATLVLATPALAQVPRQECGAFSETRRQIQSLVRPLSVVELRDPPFKLDPLQSRLFLIEAQLAERGCPDTECARAQVVQASGQASVLKRDGAKAAPFAVTLSGNLTEWLRRDGARYGAYEAYWQPGIELWPKAWFQTRGWTEYYLKARPDSARLPLADLAREVESAAVAPIASYVEKNPIAPTAQRQLRDAIARDVALHRLLFEVKSDSEIRTVAAELRGLFSPEQKKRFLAELGFEMQYGGAALQSKSQAGGYVDQYDDDRAAFASGKWKGSVSLLQMLQAYRTGDEAGVCRDNADGVAHMAELLGMKDVYVVHGQTSVVHSIAIMRDPEDPSKILRCSYDLCASVPLRGARSLTLPDDVAGDYYLAKPGSKTAAVIPSDFKLALHDAVFGRTKDLDFFGRPDLPANLAVRVGGGGVRANLVTGVEESGNQFVGAVGTYHFGDPERDRVAGQGGLGLIHRKTGLSRQDFGQLYLAHAQYLNSKWHEPAPGMRLRFASATVATATGTFFEEGSWIEVQAPPPPSPKPTESGAASAENEEKAPEPRRIRDSSWSASPFGAVLSTLGLEARLGGKNGESGLSAELKSQYAIGQSHPADLDPATLRPVHNLTYASLVGTRELSRDQRLLADFAVGWRALGPQLRGGMEWQRLQQGDRYRLGYEGALKSDAFAVAPGMTRDVFLQAMKRVAGDWTVETEARVNVDGQVGPRLNTSVRRSFGGRRERKSEAPKSPAKSSQAPKPER